MNCLTVRGLTWGWFGDMDLIFKLTKTNGCEILQNTLQNILPKKSTLDFLMVGWKIITNHITELLELSSLHDITFLKTSL